MDIFTGIKNRSDLNSLVHFMLYAAERTQVADAGTVDERRKKYDDDFFDTFEKFCKEAKSSSWKNLSEEEIENKLGAVWDGLLSARGSLLELYFEMGVRVAFALAQDLESYI